MPSAYPEPRRKNGVADKDIQTQQFNIMPEYDYSGGVQRLRGFQVTNIVGTTLRDINKTSQIVDNAVTAGGDNTQVQGLAFTIDNPVFSFPLANIGDMRITFMASAEIVVGR